jgi:hypothetical protein
MHEIHYKFDYFLTLYKEDIFYTTLLQSKSWAIRLASLDQMS